MHTKSVYFSVFLSPQIVHTFQLVLNIACLMLHVSSFFTLLSLHLQFFCLYYLHVVINELYKKSPKQSVQEQQQTDKLFVYRIITKITKRLQTVKRFALYTFTYMRTFCNLHCRFPHIRDTKQKRCKVKLQ